MTERPRAIVFDFNGTLSDDEPVLAAIYEELFAELGKPITAAQYFADLAGHTDEEMLIRWFGHADPAVIRERVERYNARVADGSTVDDATRAAVRYAAERVPVALVSAALRAEIDPVLEATELRAAFSVVVSQDDVTHGKPNPEGYLTAASLLGVAPAEMTVLEDTAVGVAAARAAGARVVALTRTLGADRLEAADLLAEGIDVALMEQLLCS
jgi:beta-phosphoglucomutase-like phosphatase (HAD superfamily)